MTKTENPYIPIFAVVVLLLAILACGGDESPTKVGEVAAPTAETSAGAVEEEAIDVTPKDALESEYIGGNASPPLPDGTPGELAVLTVSDPGIALHGSVLVIVRNNENKPVRRVSLSGTAYDPDGVLIAVGGDQGLKPNVVQPGEISLGYIFFSDVELPSNIKVDVEVTADDVDSSWTSHRDLAVTEQNRVDNRIVGMFTNTSEDLVHGPISAHVYCFNESGDLIGFHQDYTDKDEASPGDTIPFQVNLRGESTCPTYLITGSGYADYS